MDLVWWWRVDTDSLVWPIVQDFVGLSCLSTVQYWERRADRQRTWSSSAVHYSAVLYTHKVKSQAAARQAPGSAGLKEMSGMSE